eukprot:768635-Hanusia_phi.AAC.3
MLLTWTQLAVMIDLEGKTARAVTPQYEFDSFDGRMHVLQEEYTVSNVLLKGLHGCKCGNGPAQTDSTFVMDKIRSSGGQAGGAEEVSCAHCS